MYVLKRYNEFMNTFIHEKIVRCLYVEALNWEPLKLKKKRYTMFWIIFGNPPTGSGLMK